jgi:hypothetical protein
MSTECRAPSAAVEQGEQPLGLKLQRSFRIVSPGGPAGQQLQEQSVAISRRAIRYRFRSAASMAN